MYNLLNNKVMENFEIINRDNHHQKITNSQKLNKERLSLPYNNIKFDNIIPFPTLEGFLNESLFNPKSILEKDYNIFEFDIKVGHKNVLPIMGHIMLDSFGLIDENIMPVDKLNPFLTSLSEQYLETTLYHNSIHVADITQTIIIYYILLLIYNYSKN